MHSDSENDSKDRIANAVDAAFWVGVDKETQRKERNKARALRAGQWWRNQIGKGICFYCERRFRPDALTMDHKVPVIRGGRSTKTNLVPSCKECNNEKKHQLLSEWIRSREEAGLPPLACARHELY